MDKYEFSPRQFTLGQEPVPIKSIGYFSNDTKLFSALGEALNRDEWEELRNSRLGVFIKFHELEFGWGSRLVHYMLTYQLDCKKKYELWSLIGVRPVRFSLNEFEEITSLNCEYVKNLDQPLVEVGVNLERGPSIEELTAACKRCSTWSREDIMRLGYLAIYAGFIEAQRTSTPTRASLARLVMDLKAFEAYPWGRVAFKFLIESVKKLDLTKTYVVEGFVEVLQVWIYDALPEYAAGFVDPVPGATPPLLGFLGGKGRKNAKEKLQIQTRLNYYVVKDYSEMFPLWDDDVADERADNIVKAVYAGGWVWDQTHWPVGGTKLWINVKVEYQKVKTEDGQMDTSKTSKASNRSKKARSSSPIESEEESRKKPRKSPGLDMETVKADIKVWLSGLTSIMVEGISICERALSTQSCMIISLTEKVEEVEKIVRGRGEDDCTKGGSYGDVHEEDKSVGDKDEDDKAEDDKGKNEQTEDDQAEESKAEETSPQVSKPGRKRRAKTKEASPQGRQTRGNVKATGVSWKGKSCLPLASAKSDILRRLAPSQQSPFQGNSTAKVIIPNQPNRGQGYYPFDPVDRQKVSVLIDWLKLDPLRYTKHPEWFRSDRICLLDVVFTQVWSAKYTEFLDSPVNPDGSCRQLPPGALDYYTGEEPAYCKSDKTWALEIDDIYVPLHIKDNHWDEEIAKSVKPIAHMLPYMLHMLSRSEDRELYMVDFTHERISASGVPQNTQSGDCGVYCLKYIECHALLAAEIFDETNINDTEKREYKNLAVYE
ncbi:hypothetical protein N665_0142s0006 [Sinapis alba]|nr:hypothetical protein N665_0142s0006 [Sinapis alba]